MFNDSFDVAKIFVGIAFIKKLQNPIQNLPYICNSILLSLISGERITAVLNKKQRSAVKVDSEANIAICINNASFVYHTNKELTEPVLKEVNLMVKKGEMVGVIGKLGSGKTSLLESINQRLERTTGDIQVNGDISYVSQTPWLFQATIRDNVVLNNPYDEAYFRHVLQICCLTDDLNKMEEGDLTFVADKGANFSVGQKTRLALARAIYSRRDILLADCPMANIDAVSREKITTSLFTDEMKGKTVILATHDPDVLQYMDKVVFMENGFIKWQGTYVELKETDILSSLNDESDEVIISPDSEAVMSKLLNN